MSGIGLSELVLLFIIGLLVLGPERLPKVASQVGRWIGRARRTANQLRYQLEREIALADIDKSKSKPAPTKPAAQSPEADAASSPSDAAGSESVAEDSARSPAPAGEQTQAGAEAQSPPPGQSGGGDDERSSKE